MKTYVVQLEPHDDVISTRDKLSWSKARRVLLIWPRRGRVLERRVDLLLLRRYAQQQGAQLAIVTSSGEVKALARDLMIPVFSSAARAQQTAWRWPLSGKKNLAPDRIRIPAAELRTRRAEFSAPPPVNRWVRLMLFTAAVLSFLALALFFAPGARIELTPARLTQRLSIPVRASSEIRAPNPSGGIPAYPLTVLVEGQDQAASTGQIRMPDCSARGSVVLTNLTDRPLDVPAGTVVRTLSSPPARYLIVQAVRLPAGPGVTVQAQVQAEQSGSAGNAAAGQITALEGTLGLSVSVANPEPVTGGTDRTVLAPSGADYQALREKSIASLRAIALDELRSQLKPGQRLLDPTVQVEKVEEELRQPQAGEPGDRLLLSMRISFKGWYIEDRDLEVVAVSALEANREDELQPVAGSLRIEDDTSPLIQGQEAAWDINVERLLETGWDDAVVIGMLRGRSIDSAEILLRSRLVLAAPPRVDLYPTWWKWMPFLPARIELVRR